MSSSGLFDTSSPLSGLAIKLGKETNNVEAKDRTKANNISSNSITNNNISSSKYKGEHKEKKKRQKEAEKVEKLRMLVSYLKNGSSQQLLNPVALEADELELAQRYKMHLILCEDCLQAIESRHQQPFDYYSTNINHDQSNNYYNNSQYIRHNQTSMIDMHHYQQQHHHLMINSNNSNNSNNNNNNNNNNNTNNHIDNFDTNSSTSQNIAFMSASCNSVPLESETSVGSKENDDQSIVQQGTSSSIFGAESGIHMMMDVRGDLPIEETSCNPHIGAVSWVLRHSISDPGNNNYNNSSLAASTTTPSREQSPILGHSAISSSLYDAGDDLPRCANCRAKRNFGLNYHQSLITSSSSASNALDQQEHAKKLFYIDDLERKDSDSSDTNSHSAILSIAASSGADFGEKCNAISSTNNITTNINNNNNKNDNNNNNVSPAHSEIISQSAATCSITSSRNTPPPPVPLKSDLPCTTRSWSSEMMIFSSTPAANLNNNHHNHQQQQQQLLQNQTVELENQLQSPVDDNQGRKEERQTSAWTNPQNLATWIDNEVNSLINDLEVKSQSIKKEKPAKGSKRRWLSSGNRRGSSGAHSN